MGLVYARECAHVYLRYQAGVMRTGCSATAPRPEQGWMRGGCFSIVLLRLFLWFGLVLFSLPLPLPPSRQCRVHRVRESTPQLPEALLRNPNYPAKDAEGGGWRPIKNKSGPPPSCLLTFQYGPEGTKNVSTAPLPNAPTRKGGFMEGSEGWRLDHHGLRRLEVIWRKFVNK